MEGKRPKANGKLRKQIVDEQSKIRPNRADLGFD